MLGASTTSDTPLPTTLMLHSSGTGPRQFKAFESRIKGRLVCPDLRARWPQADKSWRSDADLEKVLKEVDQSNGPLDIVGHSYGGVLGMRVALARPERARKIWVHEPVLWGCYRALATPQEVQDFNALVAPFISWERSGTRDWMMEFVDFWSGPGTFESLPEPAQADLVAQSHKLFAQVVGLLADDTGPELWAKMPPFTVSVGRTAPLPQRRSMSLLASALPQATLVELPGGHMGPVTHPLAFARAVKTALHA
ncbi:MAG: pimeloyl-ACP methyl ester carboxylesterase [Cognaticolwellia sp.]|jgi:pimeloyl-ACP methyl ester carboxylesterase